ncbi:hypothetical protein COD15_03130 [Priestia megaterium]|nr:hypothetical protein COD15_03130 [Priestia megaterium]
MCTDRLLPDNLQKKALEVAINENPDNATRVTIKDTENPKPLSLLKAKKWRSGRTLRVHFIEGDQRVKQKVEHYAKMWENYANIKFDFRNDPNAEIRISFNMNSGSWSYVGTDCLLIDSPNATMNYGWLKPETPDHEYERVVVHEFGHALGCHHEHQHPNHDIPWDEEAVYRFYMGPPNNWSREAVYNNVLKRYSREETNSSRFDKASIMLYAIDDDLTLGDYAVGWNTKLSEIDKQFINSIYPF